MKIAITTYGPWRLVEAEPVTLDPPHDKPFRFGAFRFAGDPGLAGSPRLWAIFNVETGMGVGAGLTLEEALARANRNLAVYTARTFAILVRDLRRSGHVPPQAMLDAIDERTA